MRQCSELKCFSAVGRWQLLVLVFALSPCLVEAQRRIAAADLERIGAMPVRFANRVITLGEAAELVVRSGSPAGRPVDARGRQVEPLAVLLEQVSGGVEPAGIRWVSVAPWLIDELGLPKRDAGLYSVIELDTRILVHAERLFQLGQESQQATTEEKARSDDVRQLGRAISVAQELVVEHDLTAEWPTDAIGRFEGDPESLALEKPSLLYMIPPSGPTGAWMTPRRSALVDAIRARQSDGRLQPNAYRVAVEDILRAIAQDDAGRLRASLATYESLPAPGSPPFDFGVPVGWTLSPDIGRSLGMFSDTLSMGRTMVSLHLGDGDSGPSIRLYYFPGVEVDFRRTLNEWRLSSSCPALLPTDLRREFREVRIAGSSGVAVDVRCPDFVRDPFRVVGRLLHHETGSWVATLRGEPGTIDEHITAFEQFVGSLRLGSREDLARWFRLETADPPGPLTDQRVRLAIVPLGERQVIVVVSGSPDLVGRDREVLDGFLASLRFGRSERGSGESLRWDVPPGWKAIDQDSASQFSWWFQGPEQAFYSVWATLLEPRPEQNPLALTNHWRAWAGLTPWSSSELAVALSERVLDRTNVTIVEFDTPASTVTDTPPSRVPVQPGKNEFAAGGRVVGYEAPGGWTLGAQRPLRAVSFDVAKDTECSVIVLSGHGAGVRANLDRWRGQLALVPLSDEEFAGLPTLRVLGSSATLLRADGASGERRLIGLVCPLDDSTLYVKMTGPRSVVLDNEFAFAAFCGSLRFAGGKPEPDDGESRDTAAIERKVEELARRAAELLHGGQIAGAIAALDRALSPGEAQPALLRLRAFAKGRMGRHEDAIQDATRALEFQPSYAPACAEHGVKRAALGEWRTALADYDRALPSR